MSREETLTKLYGATIETLFNLEEFLDERNLIEGIISLQSKALRECIEMIWRPDEEKPQAQKQTSTEYSVSRNLEYYREKVGIFAVTTSNIGRTIEFTPAHDHPNNTQSAGKLRAYLKSLEPEGVAFKFFSDESSKLTVVIPPKYNMSDILHAVSEAYKDIKNGNGVT